MDLDGTAEDKASRANIRKSPSTSTINIIRMAEAEEKLGETSPNLSMTLEATNNANQPSQWQDQDIQHIVTRTMGGVTTKKLIERQMQQMFGIHP